MPRKKKIWTRGSPINTRKELDKALSVGFVYSENSLLTARIVKSFSEDSIRMSLKNLRLFYAE